MSVDDENCHWSMNSERGTTTRDEREVESPRPIAAIRFGKVIACTITGLTHQDVSLPPHPSVQPAGAGFARQVPWFRKGGRTRRYKIKRSETCQMGVQFVSVRSPNGNPGLRKPGREM